MSTINSLERVKDIGASLKADSKIGESLETIKTIANAAVKTAEVLDDTLEVVKHRKELVNRHKEIRELKEAWSRSIYEALEKKIDVHTMLDTTYDCLRKEIEKKQSEIHEWEMKITDYLNGPTLTVVRHGAHSEPFLSQLFNKKLTCQKCSQFITEAESISVQTLEFHLKCFTCTDCTKNLDDCRRVFCVDKHPICNNCGNVRLKSRMASLEEKKLLNFCHKALEGFQQISRIRNFKISTWRQNELFWAALCCSFRPDVVDWNSFINEEKAIDTKEQCQNYFGPENLHFIQVGLDALYKARVPMLIVKADELRECDPTTLMRQILMIQWVFQNEDPHPEGKKIWNKHFEIPKQEKKDEVPLAKGFSQLLEEVYTATAEKDVSSSPSLASSLTSSTTTLSSSSAAKEAVPSLSLAAATKSYSSVLLNAEPDSTKRE